MGVVDDQIDSDVWVPVRKNFVFYPLVRLVLFFFSSVCLPSNEIGCFSVGLFLESIDKFKLCQCYVMGYLLPEVNDPKSPSLHGNQIFTYLFSCFFLYIVRFFEYIPFPSDGSGDFPGATT